MKIHSFSTFPLFSPSVLQFMHPPVLWSPRFLDPLLRLSWKPGFFSQWENKSSLLLFNRFSNPTVSTPMNSAFSFIKMDKVSQFPLIPQIHPFSHMQEPYLQLSPLSLALLIFNPSSGGIPTSIKTCCKISYLQYDTARKHTHTDIWTLLTPCLPVGIVPFPFLCPPLEQNS